MPKLITTDDHVLRAEPGPKGVKQYKIMRGLFLVVRQKQASVSKAYVARWTHSDGEPRTWWLGIAAIDGRIVKPLLEAEGEWIEALRKRKADPGFDPAASQRDLRLQHQTEHARTVKWCFDEYMKLKGPERRKSTLYTWRASLNATLRPLQDMPIAAVTTEGVLAKIQAAYYERPSAVKKALSHFAVVWDWAKARRFCKGENPVRWDGCLEHHLQKVSAFRPVVHRKAVPAASIPGIVAALAELENAPPAKCAAKGFVKRDRVRVSAMFMLQLTIMSGLRVGKEVRLARWREFDRGRKVWTVPSERMKGGREHPVPLTEAMLDVIERARARAEAYGDAGPDAFLFPSTIVSSRGAKGQVADAAGYHLANRIFKRIAPGFDIHGLRSTLSDWANDLGYDAEVVEHVLAHKTVGVRGVYRRGTAFDARRVLMDAWSDHCLGRSVDDTKVVAFNAFKRGA